MTTHLLKSILLLSIFSTSWLFSAENTESDNTGAEASEEEKKPSWDIENPPWETYSQPIDADEGTWISLDVSPDGEEIVFDFLGDLYLMPLNGSGDRSPTRISEGISWDMQPRFSPDGTRIAFTSDRTGKSKHAGYNIWTIARDGSDPKQITDETFRLIFSPAWSPDGEYIVARKHFTSRRSLGSGEMWLYHRSGVSGAGQGGVQLTEKPNEQQDVNEPIFSPDGKYLYYSQDASGGDTFEYDKDSNKQIYVVKRLEIAKGETETYISGPGGSCRPTPSPDGKTIAFVRRLDGKSALHLFDTESGAVRVLYTELERDMQETWAIHGVYPTFAWTPDQKHLVLWAHGKIRKISVQDGSASILPFHIKDGRTVTKALRVPIKVAPEEFDVRMLRWVTVSPLGNQVAFQALGYIYVRNLPDGEPKRLTTQTDHFEFYPAYSRDGKSLAYSTWNDEKLGSIRVASSEPGQANTRKLTKQPGHFTQPIFSPDGNTIVYVKTGGGYLRSGLWSRETGIYRVPVHAGEPKRILKGGSNPQFSDENDRLYFLKGKREKDADNLGLFSVNLNGKEEQNHYTSAWATDYQLSPDGRWVAFIERYNVYLAPFLKSSKPIKVGPKAKALPVAKISEEAGINIHFSGDSSTLHWSLGPTLYSRSLAHSFTFLEDSPEEQPEEPVDEKNIGFKMGYSHPKGSIALVGGTVVTMGEAGTIENGVVLIENNRIQSVVTTKDVRIPRGTKTIDISGQIVLPGLIDTHAHGAMATQQINPQQNWVDYARLAFGVTSIHDPSNDTLSIFAASELSKAGNIVAPRIFSTGTILYGATGAYKAEVNSLEDAQFHLKRMKAVGAFSVKSYNQPRRDQRQQILAAAREIDMMVVPEGGATFMDNMNMIVDGHTGIEHTLSVRSIYDDVLDLWRDTGVGYTPTLSVAYGGLTGENYWYQIDELWKHERLKSFIPPQRLEPRARRRLMAPEEDFNHKIVAQIAKQSYDQGGLVQAGGHGQLNGIDTHWEIWSLVQGGMTPSEALECGTLHGARYLGLDGDLGSIEAGKLADLIVIESGSDPRENIRHSENIEYVVANGRVFEAATMNEIGNAEQERQPFFWEKDNAGVGQLAAPPEAAFCHGCPGGSHLSH